MIDHKGTGVAAFASVSSRAVIAVVDSHLTRNDNAIYASHFGTVSITGTTLTNNANGINTDSATGVVYTSGNNWFRLNTADGGAMLNVPPK